MNYIEPKKSLHKFRLLLEFPLFHKNYFLQMQVLKHCTVILEILIQQDGKSWDVSSFNFREIAIKCEGHRKVLHRTVSHSDLNLKPKFLNLDSVPVQYSVSLTFLLCVIELEFELYNYLFSVCYFFLPIASLQQQKQLALLYSSRWLIQAQAHRYTINIPVIGSMYSQYLIPVFQTG